MSLFSTCKRKDAAAISLLLVMLIAHTGLVSSAKRGPRALVSQDVDLEHLITPKFSSDWAVEVTGGGSSAADHLAKRHGFINRGQIGNLKNFYHFKLVLNISDMGGDQHQATRRSIGSLQEIAEQPQLTQTLQQSSGVGFVTQQRIMKHAKMQTYASPTDPLWQNQWSLLNTGQTSGPRGKDLNVEPVWMQGVTGRGVVVAFMDNGLEIDHPDLSANYDSQASWDFVHDDGDPTPDNYFGDDPDSHGTSCAGQVGMVKDNGHCGVGIAHYSHIGGLKIDYNYMTDLIESDALGHNHDHIDIYSNSWGPVDYGFSAQGPRTLLKRTLETGVNKGRNGKGVIYTFAGGNGGGNFDSCAANGYASSIYTIAVGSASQNGEQAFYDEQCAAKMAVTFAINSNTWPGPDDFWDPYKQISTTTLNGDCTDDFTGTSASTPHMSGVIALALQANPNLTWRDVQYLVAYTSNPDSLLDGEWTVNGGGLKVSHKFGFGAVDAEALVTRARRWIGVPEQQTQSFTAARTQSTATLYTPFSTTFEVTEGSGISFLEHVVLTVSLTLFVELSFEHLGYSDFDQYLEFGYSISEALEHFRELGYPKRGDTKIELTSPQGTVSTMLPYRLNDFVNEEGYDNWPFMSVHHWGENPVGQWTVKIIFDGSAESSSLSISGLKLSLYGTSETPQSVSNIPAITCNPACARARGCSGPRTLDCDVCREYRISSTLDCVSSCPRNTTIEIHNKYCLDGSTPTPVPPHEHTDPPSSGTPSPSSSKSDGEPTEQAGDNTIAIGVGVGGGAVFVISMIAISVGGCYLVHMKKKGSYHSQGFTRLPTGDASHPVPV